MVFFSFCLLPEYLSRRLHTGSLVVVFSLTLRPLSEVGLDWGGKTREKRGEDTRTVMAASQGGKMEAELTLPLAHFLP